MKVSTNSACSNKASILHAMPLVFYTCIIASLSQLQPTSKKSRRQKKAAMKAEEAELYTVRIDTLTF